MVVSEVEPQYRSLRNILTENPEPILLYSIGSSSIESGIDLAVYDRSVGGFRGVWSETSAIDDLEMGCTENLDNLKTGEVDISEDWVENVFHDAERYRIQNDGNHPNSRIG